MSDERDAALLIPIALSKRPHRAHVRALTLIRHIFNSQKDGGIGITERGVCVAVVATTMNTIGVEPSRVIKGTKQVTCLRLVVIRSACPYAVSGERGDYFALFEVHADGVDLSSIQRIARVIRQDFSTLWPCFRLATNCSAFDNATGNSRPRFSALRRMPLAAFGLKKYRGGAFFSKICDKEDPTPSLGYSEVLSVQSSPCDVTRPEFAKGHEDACEISSSVTGNKARDIFEQDKSRLEFCHDSYCFIEKTAPGSCESGSFTGDGEVLAGPSPADDIDSFKVVPSYVVYVLVALHVGPVALQDFVCVRVDFHLPATLEAASFKCQIKATQAGEEAPEGRLHVRTSGSLSGIPAPTPVNWSVLGRL